jgi:hypothetical protein
MIAELVASRDHDSLSAAIITQITDVELECDGLLTYARNPHLSESDVSSVSAAFRDLTVIL